MIKIKMVTGVTSRIYGTITIDHSLTPTMTTKVALILCTNLAENVITEITEARKNGSILKNKEEKQVVAIKLDL